MAIPKDQIGLTGSETEEAPNTDEAEGVTQLAMAAGGPLGRQITRQVLEPLTKRGAKTDLDYKVTPEAEIEVPKPVDPKEAEVKPEAVDVVDPIPAKPDPATEAEVDRALEQREEQLGKPRQVPSPSMAQRAEGIEEGPVNTRFYDNDGLAATVAAVAKEAGPELKSQTIQSLYDKALDTGVPRRVLENIFSGVPMSSKVGDNELATRMAGLQALHDVSATRLNDMMTKASKGELNEGEQLELRELLAQHNVIFGQLQGAKTDIARSLNVFKGARERRDDLGQIEVQSILDSLGGDDQLRDMAHAYLQPKTQAQRNRVLEVGLIRKSVDAMIYMAQSSFLSSPVTHVYNMAATGLTMAADIPERAAAIPVGIIRKRIARATGKEYSPDQYYAEDIIARTSGFYNGLLDGISMASKQIREGDAAAKEVYTNPLSSERFSDTPVRLGIGAFVKDFGRTPDLTESAPGKILDALGAFYSVTFRALGAGDMLMAGIAQRMELHEQAYRLAAQTIDDAVENGRTMDEAINLAKNATQRLLTERPADIEASVQGFRRQVTLTADIDTEVPTGQTYETARRIMNYRGIKPLIMFSRTVTNIGIEGAARVPGLNFFSPRFYTEWSKGGRYRDLAVSRVALGGATMLGAYALAEAGAITGAGPKQTEDRNALRGTGWQEFSATFGEDELSSSNVARLQALLGENSVTYGTGPYDGKIFVSLKRLEPVNMPFLMGAAISDAVRFGQYDEDDSNLKVLVDAATAGLAEYSTNIAALQTVNNLMRILHQQHDDGGDMIFAALDEVARTYGNVALAGTPIVGLANSSMASYIERIIDPASSDVTVTDEQMEQTGSLAGILGVRGFFEAYNRVRSKVPILSRDVAPKLDAYGDVVGAQHPDESYVESYSRIMGPRITAGHYKGKSTALREFHMAMNYGLPLPQREIHGVYLTAEVRNRYIELYTKEIQIDGMNMAEYMLSEYEEILSDYEETGMRMPIGMLQNRTKTILAAFRNKAKKKLFGIKVQEEDGDFFFDPEQEDGTLAEYPELGRQMAEHATKRYFKGN